MAIESFFQHGRHRIVAAMTLVFLGAALTGCSSSNNNASAPKPAQPAATVAKTAATPAKPATVTTPKAAADRLAAMSVDQLMNEAQKALKEDRLVAPAGDNAFEYYLEVLQKSPNNRAAQDALRETFPYGAQTVDQTINQHSFDEAQREISLLAKADPTNYTLTILRSKLDAARKFVAQQAQQQAQQQAAQQAAALKQQQEQKEAATAAAAASAQKQQEQKEAAAAQQKQQQEQAAAQKLREQQVAAAAAAAKSQNRDAQVIRQVPAKYPLDAARNGQQGWVDIEFTVNTDGSVSNAHVVDSEPRRVFDRAAIEAVSHWKFRPALINGQPTAVVAKRRIEFKLSGNG